jgi:hypothetical protein
MTNHSRASTSTVGSTSLSQPFWLSRADTFDRSASSGHAGKVLTHRQLLKEALGPAYPDEGDLLRGCTWPGSALD